MTTKNRIQKLEWQIGIRKNKKPYKMSLEDIENLKRALYNGLANVAPTSPSPMLDSYQGMRNHFFIEIVMKDDTEEEKEKVREQFDHFFFNVITQKERGDLFLELTSGDVLPDDYEFRSLNKLFAFINKVCHNNNVDLPKS